MTANTKLHCGAYCVFLPVLALRCLIKCGPPSIEKQTVWIVVLLMVNFLIGYDVWGSVIVGIEVDFDSSKY